MNLQVNLNPANTKVFVAGAGVMGMGIAQLAAQSGHSVLLYDVCQTRSQSAKESLGKTFQHLVSREKLSSEEATRAFSSIELASDLADASQAGIVIEAIVEDRVEKRALFQSLEEFVSSECILASNTSSLSITELGSGLKHPDRLLGMHFFNPAPVMKLVEVISGMQTSSAIADQVVDLVKTWEKIPVRANSTPGFIVNRIARPFYAEALALLQERTIEPVDLDFCFRDAGFRMGPCELMDLIGHDTNYQVTKSIFEANYFDRRFTPSLIQKSLIDAGFLGRKSGRGFYDYSKSQEKCEPETILSEPDKIPHWPNLLLRGSNPVADHIDSVLRKFDISFQRENGSSGCELESNDAKLRLTDGRMASQMGNEVAVFDLIFEPNQSPTVAYAVSDHSSRNFVSDVENWLRLFGIRPLLIQDSAGLVVARTVAMLINEASDAILQSVCSESDADIAIRAGLNYPAGPFEWLNLVGIDYVVDFIENLAEVYRGERYRVSPLLLRRRSN